MKADNVRMILDGIRDVEKTATDTRGYYTTHYEDIVAFMDELEARGIRCIDVRVDAMSLNVHVVGGQNEYEELVRAGSAKGLRRIKIPDGKFSTDYGYMTANGEFPNGKEFAIWYNFSSVQCRRVKIGTRMVEQDVYEVQCAEPDATNVAAE